MIYIYALLDPISGDIRYIGKSKNPALRLRSHVNVALRDEDSRRKSRWIRKLCSQRLEPELKILEEVKEDNWEEAEYKWIAHYRERGIDLCNHTDGGDGVHNPDEESRKRLSATRKRLWREDKEFKDRMLKVFRSSQRCQRISAALTGKSKSAEHIAKLPQNRPGWHHTPEAIAKIKANAKGHRFSPEEVELLRQRNMGNQYGIGNKSRTGQTQSREERLKKSLSLKQRSKSEEHKQRIAEGMRRAWAAGLRKKSSGYKRVSWPSYEWLEKRLEGMTTKELAEELDVKPGTLSGKLYRERKRRQRERET